MTSQLLMLEKYTDALANAVEMKVWRVPMSGDFPHGNKYSLVYIVDGERVVGYDNAEGKGDHKHIGAKESVYDFIGVRRLLRDFWADVELFKEIHNEG